MPRGRRRIHRTHTERPRHRGNSEQRVRLRAEVRRGPYDQGTGEGSARDEGGRVRRAARGSSRRPDVRGPEAPLERGRRHKRLRSDILHFVQRRVGGGRG